MLKHQSEHVLSMFMLTVCSMKDTPGQRLARLLHIAAFFPHYSYRYCDKGLLMQDDLVVWKPPLAYREKSLCQLIVVDDGSRKSS